MTHRVTVGLRSSFQTRPEQRIEELWRIAAGPIRRARAQNLSGLRVAVAPIRARDRGVDVTSSEILRRSSRVVR